MEEIEKYVKEVILPRKKPDYSLFKIKRYF